jgi:hypothetical protein
MTISKSFGLTSLQFYDLHVKGFFATNQEKHQQRSSTGSSNQNGSSYLVGINQQQSPPSPRENDDFINRIDMDHIKNAAPPGQIVSQKVATTTPTFESDWIEQLDPRKTALDLIKNANIRKLLQENGYQTIESDLRKSTRKRKPTSFYQASPSIEHEVIRKVSPASHESNDSIATNYDSIDEDETDEDSSEMGSDSEMEKDILSRESKAKKEKSGSSSKGKFSGKKVYTFEDRYSQLQDFLRKTGHTKVPFKYPPNPSLGYWVASVRHNHKRLKQGLPLKIALTWEQVDILSNTPGWVWCARTV